mgnify:FL=1
MGFKEAAFQDIKNVFLNLDEFGEVHVVDGKEMVVIVDGLEVVERSKKQIEKGRIDGVFEKQILMYVARTDFGLLPAVGRSLKLDRGMYRVIDAIDEGGIYSITLGAIRS